MANILEKIWDDVAGGSPPEKGLKQLRGPSSGQYPDVPDDARRIMERRLSTGAYQSPAQNIAIKRPEKIGMLDVDSPAGTPGSLGAASPASPSMASPSSYLKEKDNVWRSVFHPGQNKVMRKVGSDKFDKAQPNAPSVYDWLYSSDSKPEYR
jgi:hypothetical protein